MLKRYILLLLIWLCGLYAHSQEIAETLNKYDSFSFSETYNTQGRIHNYYGYHTNDVWIIVNLIRPMKLTVSHCGSGLNGTYAYLLDSNQRLIAEDVDPGGGCSNPFHAYLEKELPAGLYYVVSESDDYNGDITVNIEGVFMMQSIDAGTIRVESTYTDTKSTKLNGHIYGNSEYDVAYKFYLPIKQLVTISNCGSGVNDTYIYLLNSSQRIIGRSDYSYYTECSNRNQAYIQRNLDPGTYYVISEGVNEKGSITTTIQTDYAEPEDGYTDIGNKNSAFSYSESDYTWIDEEETFVGPSRGDSYFRLIIGVRMEIEVSNCGSEVANTNLYIVDKKLNTIASSIENPVDSPCSNPDHAYIKTTLDPGTYYFVTESPGEEGDIMINVSGTLITNDGGGNPDMPNPSEELSQNQNYILTINPTVPTTVVNGLNVHNSIQKVKYYDGLGRPFEEIQRWGNPEKHDLVSYQEYDPLGRESNSWLPVVAEYNNGQYLSLTQYKFYGNNIDPNDSKTYSKPVYEASPLSRVVEQYGPGQHWHDQGIATRTSFLTNNAGLPCRLYKTPDNRQDASVIKSGDYPANELYVTQLTSEENHITYEFKNKLGQTVLTRQMDGAIAHDTYYIYDNYGNLKTVLPPLASDHLSANTTWPETDPYLEQYAYLYKYDNWNRCIAKKIPGTDWTYYVYDKANRLIFTQDGELRDDDENKWTITIPDKEGRTVFTGVIYNYDFEIDDEHWSGTISSRLNVDNLVESVRNGEIAFYAEYRGEDSFPSGYQLVAYNCTATEISPTGNSLVYIYPDIYKVDYYDNYEFLNKHDFPNYIYDSSRENDGYGTPYTNGAQTFLTGTMVCDQYDSERIYTAFYYDDRGRLIQSQSSNSLNGKDTEYIAYNFTGLPTKRMLVHTANGQATQTELYAYTYDHMGRLLETTHKKNTDPVYSLAKNTYDAWGRLSSTTRNNQPALTDHNTYNVRSWLTSKTGTQFNEYLSYTPGGNVETMQWGYPSDMRSYTYAYDGLSRLKTASYSGIGNEAYNTAYTYDKHGNILTLQRYGRTATGSAATSFGIIDNLEMAYNGNQLVNVIEHGPNVSLSQSNDFKKYSQANRTYDYNKNGAMTKDLNKGISGISYNSLNLPIELYINTPSGNARNSYTYLSDGRKLRVVHKSGANFSTTHTTDYVGNKIYENGSLKRILVDGGYIENGIYHFYFTDHLGNTRAVVNANGNVVQRNQYYPFGMAFAETSSSEQDKQPYQYNGKELDRRSGLNLYDYSARYMEPALGRFTTMDPLVEKYYSISPYAYCANNPMRFVDKDGKKVYLMPGASNEFKTFFTIAVLHLNQNGASSMLAKLNDSDQIYFIREGQGFSGFDIENKTIIWDPLMGILTNEGHVMSPTAVLNHEVDHALQYDTNMEQMIQDLTHDGSPYQNAEEKRVITGSEQVTAKKLGEIKEGEVTRRDHGGQKIKTTGVTSTRGVTELDEVIVKPNNNSNENIWNNMPIWNSDFMQ